MVDDVLFSLFDSKIGQIPIITSLDDKIATDICQHVVMSIMASASIEMEVTIEGESIIPLMEYGKICFAYYFYVESPSLLEPSFGFIAYLSELENKNIIYSNIECLKEFIISIKNQILASITIDSTVKEIKLIDSTKELIFSLRKPIRELIGDNFRESKLDVNSELKFITSIGLVFFNENKQISTSYIEGIDEEVLQKISLRIFVGILTKIDNNQLKRGEGIIPVVESNEMVFCYFFKSNDSVKIGLLLFFSNNRLALYKWAPILSQEAKMISESVLPDKLSNFTKKKLHLILNSFETIARGQIEKLIERDMVQHDFKSNTDLFWNYKGIESIIEALIVNKNVFLVDAVNLEGAMSFIQILDNFVPHRDLILTLEKNFQPNQMGQVVVLESNPDKDFEKNNIIFSLEKKKVISGKSSNYTKQLVKKLHNFKTFAEIKQEMDIEINIILDEVGKLVETAGLDDNQLIKKKIDEIILKLPNKDMFDIVKELTIYYNPILAKFIAEKAVYTLRSDLWNI